MDYQHIVQELAMLVWKFDCKEQDGELKIICRPSPSPGRFRRQDDWIPVGRIFQNGRKPAKIVELYAKAPPYLESLKNEEFASKPVLLNAVRRESFRHRAKEWFVSYLSAEIKQLEEAD